MAFDPQMKVWTTLSVIFWVFEIIITSIVLKMFFTKKRNQKIKYMTPIRLGIALFIFELVAGIVMIYLRTCFMIRTYTNYADLPHPMRPMADVLDPFGGFCIIVSFLIILYVFISRLYSSFHETVYDYPKWFYIFIISEVTVVGIITFIGGILGEMAVITGIAILLHILNCIFLTILFIYSLKKIAPFKSTKDNEYLISIMVKYVALLSIAMITSLLLSISMVIAGVSDENMSVEGVILVFQPIDASINVLCVYLQFEFTDDHYMKCLAKYHNFVQYLFTKQMQTERNLQQEMMISTETETVTNSTSDNVDSPQDKTMEMPTVTTVEP